MRVGAVVERSAEFSELAKRVHQIDERLKTGFNGLDFGEGVQNVIIGVLLFRQSPDSFFPVRPFRFTRAWKTPAMPSRPAEAWRNIVEFDVQPDISLDPPPIAAAILQGFQKWKPRFQRIKDFDTEGFYASLANVLRIDKSA